MVDWTGVLFDAERFIGLAGQIGEQIAAASNVVDEIFLDLPDKCSAAIPNTVYNFARHYAITGLYREFLDLCNRYGVEPFVGLPVVKDYSQVIENNDLAEPFITDDFLAGEAWKSWIKACADALECKMYNDQSDAIDFGDCEDFEGRVMSGCDCERLVNAHPLRDRLIRTLSAEERACMIKDYKKALSTCWGEDCIDDDVPSMLNSLFDAYPYASVYDGVFTILQGMLACAYVFEDEGAFQKVLEVDFAKFKNAAVPQRAKEFVYAELEQIRRLSDRMVLSVDDAKLVLCTLVGWNSDSQFPNMLQCTLDLSLIAVFLVMEFMVKKEELK